LKDCRRARLGNCLGQSVPKLVRRFGSQGVEPRKARHVISNVQDVLARAGDAHSSRKSTVRGRTAKEVRRSNVGWIALDIARSRRAHCEPRRAFAFVWCERGRVMLASGGPRSSRAHPASRARQSALFRCTVCAHVDATRRRGRREQRGKGAERRATRKLTWLWRSRRRR
jgi:hypothetical protein